MTDRAAVPAPAESVRPLELFFDLVFVFAITQIASVLAVHPDPQGLARVVVLLALTWWMYGGYAWLTNALDLDRTRPRLLLLGGMASFFVMSLAVPRAFEPGPWGVVLGLGYLSVVLVHTAGFLHTSGRVGIARVGPLNLVSALMVVAAGLAPPGWRLTVLALAGLLQIVTPFLVGTGGFTVGAGHFVERHGLAVIILLGESIVEVGSAATRQSALVDVLPGALLALALTAAQWWLYFDREERDSEALLENAPAGRRSAIALYSFGYSYLVMILGIAVSAVGMQEAVDAFDRPLEGLRWLLLPLGAGLYLLGLACFRRALAGPGSWPQLRLAGAAAMLLVAPAGRWVGGWAALALTAGLLLGLLITESAWGKRPAG
ncbi:low temperature requirement protein LtrA [Kitasatospora sp. MAA4]|uniref:low temperature requirement protein A n=1 Tax=Kitasatospora sp. MAA4 TaxID=3035093 RepID=UPI002476BAD8|nr:low temperature requirement protein A [Kitasatospora sp. MAA4]MDH6135669.1 low temperature requirement protein LtrA [Kitasatospora sp. MAA4]